MEGYFDFVLCALLNLKELDWNNDFPMVTACNILAIIFIVLCCVLPIFMIIQYARKVNDWNREEFKARYGTLLENSNLEYKGSKWLVLLVPMSYFLRRLLFCLVLVFWVDVFWPQVAIQLMASTCIIILLQWNRTLTSNFATNMETFNEVISLIILYILLCFSDWVPDPETRNDCGKVFIAVVGFYLLVHIYQLLADVFRRCRF